MTAVANAGYKFVSWNDGTTTATKTFIVTSNVTYTATFVKAQYTITFDSAGGSAVSSITADYGTSVTAPADPTREGYTFTGWSPVVPTTMPASNITCVAQWEINTYTVTLVAGTGGTVLGQGTYDYGTSVRILATPGSGYVFTSWSDGGAMTHDITITGDVTLTATFKAVQGTTYTITVDSGTNGSIVGNTTIESGTSAIFYILADTDYIVTNVTIDGISVGTMGSYTFSNVTANHSISATFDYSNGATTEVDKEGNVTENIVTVIGTITETVSRTTLVDGSTDMLVNIVDTSNGVETTAFNNGTETSVITTITVDSTSESGVSVSFVDDFVMDAALAQAATAAAAAGIEDPNPVVEISVISGSRTDERCVVEMSLDSMKSIDDASAEVEIVSDNGTMTLDSDVVSTLAAGEGDTVSLTIGFASKDDLNEKQREAVGDNTIIELSATVGTTAVYDLGGTVTITIPYILKAGEDPANIQIWYLDDNGNIETFSAVYDSVTETVSFTTTHFSYYAIAFTTDSESISIWIYVAVIVIVLILVCIVGYYFGVVKKRAI
ncbi:MAG: InlB B-repeat-containing protein [Candidatus Methanogranum gryphiswaldense]|nr:MAG: InlB B-repeat-containing protein [Candidatus Methanogranum sp. U3.2.1]